MKILLLGLLMALSFAGPDRPAYAEAVDQAYIETFVRRGEQMVAKPSMIVRVGSDGEIELGREPRIGLKFRVDLIEKDRRRLNIVALLDGDEIAHQQLEFVGDEDAEATFEGGGYSWRVRAARASVKLLKQRQRRE